ncbi:MAG: hypothetical protein H0X40_02085 [Chthoniobacterales bacterium]|nr:hypothetical protein [Chthoniobacterales bacterium]
MKTTLAVNFSELLERAPHHLATFRERTADLSREEKGIRRSEMFFLYAAVADFAPKRIIESGRARAQSTLVLSSLFPDAEIISLESDGISPDVAIAAERLRDQHNVDCRFGDSRVLLPQIVREGDVVLIDGPKDFRAVKLALSLLRAAKPASVFVHDLWPGSPARSFVDRSLPSAFLSDAPRWVSSYAMLDSKRSAAPILPPNARVVYGATLGCFPAGTENYLIRLGQCGFAQGWERLRANLGRAEEKDRPPDHTVVA